MSESVQLLKPSSLSGRIISLDVLRGIAVLGILIMNIQSFSMISEAYINPTAYGNLAGINKWVWIISHILADSKFMSIFSMLFGAGVIIFTNRAIEKGHKASVLFYRRMFWLLLFGLTHAYLIWYGDILTSYALCGSLVFLFRKSSIKTLLIVATVFFTIPILLSIMAGLSIPSWPEQQYVESVGQWLPPAEKVQAQIETYQGSWLTQMPARIEQAVFLQTFLFLWATLWRVTAMMLLGIVLYKLDIITAKRSNAYYRRLSIIGLGSGIILTGLGIVLNFNNNWHYDYSMFFGDQFNYLGSVAAALGFIGIVMMICKSHRFMRFKQIFASVGKMAFTNYILMSIICMFIFYGNGLGLFGIVERWEQVMLVIGIWSTILIISHIWLKHFYFGPLEWLWRTLTYWHIQPFKKN